MRKKKIAIMAGILICGLTWSFIGWANDSLFYSYKVKKEDTLWELFRENWLVVARINKISHKFLRPGMNLRVPYDWETVKNYTPLLNQIPNREKKFILVDLQKQFLGAYESGELKFWCPISSGYPGESETPKGEFRILWKHKNHFSSIYPEPKGGAPMKYGLMFTQSGHWIHAGILRGWASSNGCIRLFKKEAKKLFLWAETKTPIEII